MTEKDLNPARNENENMKLPYTRDDFISGQEVRWCPGCGDYSILATAQRTLAKFSLPKENYVFISGIGCSSRLPYYMNTYGFHTIHGRAPTIATGLKCVNPNLSIWVVTGDGDGLSIGGNHLIHCMRRNVDLNILLVNNQIYGLTKGQYSPTSEFGKITATSPMGTIEQPVNALCVAIASEASFIARTVDADPLHMSYVMERALKHKGTSFIEIYQNCNIFNDKAHASVTGRETREDRMVYLESGKPLIFGKKRDKAIKLKNFAPEIIDANSVNQKEILIHDEKNPHPHYAYFLTQMKYPEMPVPFGIFRAIERPTYEFLLDQQIKDAVKARGKGELQNLIYGGETWKVP